MKTKLVKVGYAPMQAAENGDVTYGDIVQLESALSGGREYSAEPNGESADIYADSVSVYSEEANNGYDIKLVLLALIDKVEKEWLGYQVDDAKKTTTEYADSSARPHFCLVVADATTDGAGEVTFFYNCQVSKRPSIAGKSAESGKLDPQFQEFQIAARPRQSDGLVRHKITGKTIPAKVPEPAVPGEVS